MSFGVCNIIFSRVFWDGSVDVRSCVVLCEIESLLLDIDNNNSTGPQCFAYGHGSMKVSLRSINQLYMIRQVYIPGKLTEDQPVQHQTQRHWHYAAFWQRC